MQEGSPVRWAISESLRQAQSHRPNLEVAPQPDLGFIYGPLRDLFSHQRQDLARILKKLAILEVRFQREYLGEEEIDWVQRFDTNTDLFDRVTTTSPHDLADSLTENDLVAFQNLCPQNVIQEDTSFQYMHRRWNRLCRTVQESIAVDSDLGLLLADLATASILSLAILNLLTLRPGITY